MSNSYEIEIGGRTISMETGSLAPQAGGSVVMRCGDTVVLVTATMGGIREGVDFLPLTVDYEERMYAAGRIPGSFFRREGRPSTEAILICRLTDRPLRPRFPKGLRNDVQVISTVLSVDHVNPPNVLAIIGASAALSISQIPFDGPIAATIMGYVNGEYVVNPSYEQLSQSDLELTVAGSRDAVIMVEAGANQVPEAAVLEALRIGQENNLKLIELQDRMAKEVGKPKAEVKLPIPPDAVLVGRIAEIAQARLETVIDQGEGRGERSAAVREVEQAAVEQLADSYPAAQVGKLFDDLLKKVVRAKVLTEGKRPDGRKLNEVRPLSSAVGILPRTHGTGLFQRGETQILSVVTLGSLALEQKIDSLSPVESKRYMHHYNFPPYSTGEARRIGTPGRREIGHGALAERALEPVIPDPVEFPYALRVVSEALSSNGSTSMGSVCGSSLALMDAGVPIKAPVSGVAMGLMTDEAGRYAILTDIQGVEDFMGDMDFKVAGTAEGITALQMDIKTSGVTPEILREAMEQAHEGRLFILGHMLKTLSAPRKEMSAYAPRMIRLQIPVEKIGAIIGPGGKTIRGIIEATGVSIDVDNDGSVTIGSSDGEAAQKAISMVEGLTKEVEVGQVYTGKVVRLMNFGAFVEILPGKDGLVHVSELADYRVPSVEEVVQVGDELTVMVTEIDRMGRVNLSRRAVLEGKSPEEARSAASSNGDRPGRPERAGGGARDRGPRGDGPRDRGRPPRDRD
jgi:polyribonucleotide nucleotidyltransferase